MKLSTVIIGCLIYFFISVSIFPFAQAREIGVRGRYIYDYADRISTETELSLSSYLIGIDQRTGYELVIVFPSYKMNDTDIIDWFNEHGVGKEKVDTGASLFIFPDNAWFMSIGSGNDKVSVPYSKTKGDKILQNLSSDFSLSLLRYIDALGKKIDEPKSTEVQIFNTVADNIDMILAWGALISLIVLLIQQYDGFQFCDLIIPGIIMLLLVFFVALSSVGSSEVTTYDTYGIITSSFHDSYDYVTSHTYYVDDVPITVYEHHTRYINNVNFKSYELKDYSYRFESTDNQGAWQRDIGEIDGITIHIKSGSLFGIFGFNDFSGGKSIGDGCWG